MNGYELTLNEKIYKSWKMANLPRSESCKN